MSVMSVLSEGGNPVQTPEKGVMSVMSVLSEGGNPAQEPEKGVKSVLSVLSEGGNPVQAPPATLTATWAEVDRLPLLADDREFIRERIRRRPDAAALLARYLIVWRAGADGEPVSFRKSNKGRFAANTWLRRATEGERNE